MSKYISIHLWAFTIDQFRDTGIRVLVPTLFGMENTFFMAFLLPFGEVDLWQISNNMASTETHTLFFVGLL